MNKYYKMCKDQHLCVACQKPVEQLADGKYPAYCKSCNTYYTAEQRQKREEARATQTCYCCRKPTEINPKTQKPYLHCTECRARESERQKGIFAERREKHLCATCGKPVTPLPNGKYKSRCKKCIQKQLEYLRRHRERSKSNDDTRAV